jgi:hypothetical protein
MAEAMGRGVVVSEPLVVWLGKVESVSYERLRAA